MFEQLLEYQKCMEAIPESFLLLLTAIAIWSLIWKGFALWKTAGNKSKVWFVALLIVNTVGILEILYIFVFSKKKEKNNPQI
ncbi:MAG: DUF5652 family protein [Patescibacteria group bacterium]